MSARHSQPATSPVGEKGEKSLFINAETGYGIVLSQILFSPEKGSAAQSSCWADFPSPCASPRCTPVGEGRSGKAWLGLAWPGLAWLCDLAGFGSADGTPEAGGGSGAGEGLGVPVVGVGLHADPSLQGRIYRVVSAHALGSGFTFLPRVLEMLTLKREVSLVDCVSDFGF